MASRIENEIVGFRGSLEKLLAGPEKSLEELNDIISALKKIPITIDLLRRTKIGQTVQEVKKNHTDDDAGQQARALLAKWKKDCEPKEEEKKPAPPVVKATAESVTSVPVIKRSESTQSKQDDDLLDESHYDALGPIRKKVCLCVPDLKPLRSHHCNIPRHTTLYFHR